MTHTPPNDNHPERRVTDALPQHFEGDALARLAKAHPAFDEAQIESIDMDAVLPVGHEPDDEVSPSSAPAAPAALDSEQSKARQLFARFRVALADFDMTTVTRVDADMVKRGDVIEIRTFAGSVYLVIVDRILGIAAGAGEILCECRYDLQNQRLPVHAASVILPVCTKNHVITTADGTQRKASRALKMTAAIALPDEVTKLLRENFFNEIRLYANPQPERLRPVDVVRGIRRFALRLKAATSGR
jgi:hypothetical protein